MKLRAEIYCMQTPSELEKLREKFDHVNWLECSSERVMIADLLQCSIGKWTLLINSDIELTPEADRIQELETVIGDGMLYLIRTNHDPCMQNVAPEPWGIDGFFFCPDSMEPFSGSQFSIGAPWWDYALPSSYLKRNRSLYMLGSQVALHERHTVNWSRQAWEQRAHETIHLLGGQATIHPHLLLEAIKIYATIRSKAKTLE
jgi:hypothetical protein